MGGSETGGSVPNPEEQRPTLRTALPTTRRWNEKASASVHSLIWKATTEGRYLLIGDTGTGLNWTQGEEKQFEVNDDFVAP